MTALAVMTIVAPGIYGLNKQDSIDTLDPRFSLDAKNCVQDTTGRLASRKGYVSVTTSPLGGAPNIQQLFEYVKQDGTTQFLSAANLNIYSGSTALTSVYSTAITANNWQAVNFNNFMWFFQRNHAPLRWNGTTMVTIASLGGTGTPPQANAVLAAFSRLWALDTSTDAVTLYFSDTLTGQNWSGGTSGTLNLSTVWQNGMDTGVAVSSFQNFLFIFGRKSILIYQGASNPSTMSLVDVIKGVGCISRDSIQNTGTDIIFLSDTGLRSLQRTIQTTTMPLQDLSKNNRDFLLGYAFVDDLTLTRSAYHEPEGFYLINFPTAGITFVLNLRNQLEDGTYATTYWSAINPKAILSSRDRTLYFGHGGKITKYSGYKDNDSSGYDWQWFSAWSVFDNSGRTYIVKKIVLVLTGANGQIVTIKWFWDYSNSGASYQQTISGTGVAEYGVAQYGINEYSTGIFVNQKSVPGKLTGKVIQIGASTTINGSPLAIHKSDVYVKQGRMI